MIRSLVNKTEIYLQLANKFGVDIKLVKDICEHQFKELSKHIHEEKEEDFKLPLIGKVIQKHKPPLKGVLDDFDF